jgi:repressor LexA
MQTRTKRQHEVLEYITDFIDERGYEPSYQQIARAIGVRSKGAIAKHIAALEKQGLISRTHENGTFGLDLMPHGSISDAVARVEWLKIEYDSAEPDKPEEPIFVAKALLGSVPLKSIRSFRVPDDSMLEDHICEGDIAFVEEQSFARDRDCVVALVNNEWPVIKKFYRQGADIELRPANPDFESIVLPANNVRLLAVFRGLIRPVR